MPEISGSPNIIFYASVLAKVIKQDDCDAFARLHDALGKLLDTKELTKVEDLARVYTELPEHILNSKIAWLQSHDKSLDLAAILNADVGNVTTNDSVKSTDVKPETSQMNDQAANHHDHGLQQAKKKKNKKNKTKRKQAENIGPEEVAKVEEKEEVHMEAKMEKTSAIEEPEVPDPDAPTKRKKKKKKKKKAKSSANKQDDNEPEKQEITPLEPVECKSPEEVLVSALDSGIGSCVASGGEDKSSVLSGGTIESNGEHVEAATPTFNFEWEGGSNVINNLLQNEKVFVEHTDKNVTDSNDPNHSNHYEISFGVPFVEEPKAIKTQPTVTQKRKKTKNRKPTAKNDSAKTSHNNLAAIGAKGNEHFEISFGTNSPIEADKKTASDVAAKQVPKQQKTDSRNSTFDHESAVRFLWAEWNRTVQK